MSFIILVCALRAYSSTLRQTPVAQGQGDKVSFRRTGGDVSGGRENASPFPAPRKRGAVVPFVALFCYLLFRCCLFSHLLFKLIQFRLMAFDLQVPDFLFLNSFF